MMRRLWARLRAFYRRLSISNKLFYAYALILTVPAVVIAFLFIGRSEQQAYADAAAANEEAAARLESTLRSRAALVENTAAVALSQKRFLEFVGTDMDADGLSLVKFSQNELKQMKSIVQSNELIESISFYLDNPGLHEIWPELYRIGRLEPASLRAAAKTEGTLYSLFPAGGGGNYLSCYKPVYRNGRDVGVLELRLPYVAFFSELYGEAPGDSFLALLPREEPGRAVCDPGGGFVQQHGDELPALLGLLAGEMDVLEAGKPVEANLGGQTYYASYRYLPQLDSYIVSLFSRSRFLQQANLSRLLVLGIAAAALVGLFLITSLVTRRTFKRLDLVLASMRRVQAGNLDAEIDALPQGGDEIDEVALNYNRMIERVRRLLTQVVDKQLLAKNAELKALQSQINSHFLYNALESIRMLAEVEQKPNIADALVSLGALMRYSMSWKNETVALREELLNMESYIRFINFMDCTDISLEAPLPEEVLAYRIPKMCMQPIVENAVNHGAPTDGRKLRIAIRSRVEAGALCLEITDNGAGMPPERLEQLRRLLAGEAEEPLRFGKNGIGIENVHRRLRLNYGEAFGLELESEPDRFTRVTLRLPWDSGTLGGW